MAVQKTYAIDESNVQLLAGEIFQIIENHYIRRSVYEAEIDELQGRIAALEATNLYQIEVTPGGDLTMVIPDTEDPSVDLDVVGNDLILSMDDGVTSTLESYSFSPNSDGDLILSV